MQALGSHDSSVMQAPGSRDSPAMQAPGSRGVNVYPWNTPCFLHHRGVSTPQCLHHRGVSTPRCLHQRGVILLISLNFKSLKQLEKGTIIQKLLYLLNYLPHEMKFLFKNYTTRNPSDRLPGSCTSGEST